MEFILEKVSISVDFKFAAIIRALKSSNMNEASYSSAIIFPIQKGFIKSAENFNMLLWLTSWPQ